MSKPHTVSLDIMRAINQIGSHVTNAQLRNCGGIEQTYSDNTVSGRLNYLTNRGFLSREGKGPRRRLYITEAGLNFMTDPTRDDDTGGCTISKPESIHAHERKRRPCLQCRREFNSEWAGHRVCLSCKQLTGRQNADSLGAQWEGCATC